MWCTPKSSRHLDPVWELQNRKATAADYLNLLRKHDMKIVIQDAIEKGILTKSNAMRVKSEYLRFLALHLANERASIPVGGRIDALWHHHLLFTENYTQMGRKSRTHYIHHRPEILDRHKSTRPVSQDSIDILYRAAFKRVRPIGFWT